MGDTLPPSCSKLPYDLQASFPIKLIKVDSSDFCPVSSFCSWADTVLVGRAKSGPGAEGRVELKEPGGRVPVDGF